MDETITPRGFELVTFKDVNNQDCSLQQSSAILDYEDDHAWDHPGSSGIWLGIDHNRMHLNRKQIEILINYLQQWHKTGKLFYRNIR